LRQVSKNFKIMATITLDYNSRNAHARNALNLLLSMGYFKMQSSRKTHKTVTFTDFGLSAPSTYKFNREEANAR